MNLNLTGEKKNPKFYMNNIFLPIIGLEIHVELATASKMFCGCPAYHFGKNPNTQTCPVCLGLPGALPVPNKKAVEWTAMLGLALNCKVAKHSKFDRKHYFYPDLPKGYQISQYDEPLATDGWLEIPYKVRYPHISKSFGDDKSGLKSLPDLSNYKTRIRRVHLEEDTGKLQHKKVYDKNVTLVDFNRSGVPLVEIVTEPDIHSASEAKEFTQKLQKIVRFLDISDCDMEKGSMRLEANISLMKVKNSKYEENKKVKLPNYKVELKNINSFRFLEKAINYEIDRQKKILSNGKTPIQETCGWDEAKNITFSQRTKEEEADYRYFPEPDIPPMEFSLAYFNNLRKNIPILPEEIENIFIQKYGIRREYAKILVSDRKSSAIAEKILKIAVKEKVNADDLAGYIVNQKINIGNANISKLVSEIKDKSSSKIDDKNLLISLIDEAIDSNPKAVEDFKKGKIQAAAVIIGTVMKKTKGKADPLLVKKFLSSRL